VVLVRDAPWRARTSRVTPIAAGDPMRVVSISGLVLEVEPVDAVDNESTGQWRSH
jgi:membrane protein implicated in regulation of membrane protease activity